MDGFWSGAAKTLAANTAEKDQGSRELHVMMTRMNVNSKRRFWKGDTGLLIRMQLRFIRSCSSRIMASGGYMQGSGDVNYLA